MIDPDEHISPIPEFREQDMRRVEARHGNRHKEADDQTKRRFVDRDDLLELYRKELR